MGSDIGKWAQQIEQARALGAPCRPPSRSDPVFSILDGYQVSRLCLERRLSSDPVRRVGWKIGLSSLPSQKRFGVDHAIFGYLTSEMKHASGARIPRAGLIRPEAEGEVAFILGKDLQGPGLSIEDVIDATDHVVACIEIIDSRFVQGSELRAQDIVADNSAAAAFVLGSDPVSLGQIELREARMSLRIDGQVVSTGTGEAVMGHPLRSVAWLGDELARSGEALRAGDIVVSGSYGPPVPFGFGTSCVVEITGLGQVSCTLGE